MPEYAVGIDFGTLSCRAVLVRVRDGEEIASSALEYPHGVMDSELPCGVKLEADWALQHPLDYITAATDAVSDVMKRSGLSGGDIVGVGIDFTSCTALPVKADGTPLCFLGENETNPHAYVKLWKHHAAQRQADRINERAAARGEKWLGLFGGRLSSESLFPKLLQIYEQAPEIFGGMDLFVEAADWVVWRMTGSFSRNMCSMGYKAIWNERDGYPSADFLESLSPGFSAALEKLAGMPAPQGARAGGMCADFAERCGLNAGTPVAVANVDAHVTVPALGIDSPGKLLAIMGTSTCHMLLGSERHEVPGVVGIVKDGIMPGFYGYEAGQSCVGDHFAWVVDNLVPPRYFTEAEKQGMNIHAYLRSLAQAQRPGESGLLALDWWNGNRSVLVDADLSGMMLGMSLRTRVEEIYRALIEATAYGTRMIIETFEKSRLPVEEFYASGGIPQKDPMTMQIYADVINRPVKIAGSANGPALGAAMFGAVAAGEACGGYSDIFAAARAMGRVRDEVYLPKAENVERYNLIYREYKILHDYFGRGEHKSNYGNDYGGNDYGGNDYGGNDIMKRLRKLKH